MKNKKKLLVVGGTGFLGFHLCKEALKKIEDLSATIVKNIENYKSPEAGSYKNRKSSEPESGRTTLINLKNA